MAFLGSLQSSFNQKKVQRGTLRRYSSIHHQILNVPSDKKLLPRGKETRARRGASVGLFAKGGGLEGAVKAQSARSDVGERTRIEIEARRMSSRRDLCASRSLVRVWSGWIGGEEELEGFCRLEFWA